MHPENTTKKAAHDVPNGCEAELFQQLISDHQRKIFLFAFVLLQNEADAKDVLEETNLALWRKCYEYRQGSDFWRWARHIAFCEVLKCRQKKSQSQRLFTDEFIKVLATELGKSWNDLDARREVLRSCLQEMNDEDRGLLMRRYKPGATTRSVAEGEALHRIRKTLLEDINRTVAREERSLVTHPV
jgi:RNA polymerase sigma-70 factor (ECF subfamily)